MQINMTFETVTLRNDKFKGEKDKILRCLQTLLQIIHTFVIKKKIQMIHFDKVRRNLKIITLNRCVKSQMN